MFNPDRLSTGLKGLMAATLLAVSTVAALADEAKLKIATQLSGTVNWEVTTIKSNGLDRKNGFSFEVMDVDAGPAAQIAMLAGEADVIVSDWLWVARQRAEGRDLVFIPYSRAVGALHVKADSPVKSLADLKGKTIGVAGGPVDKSWLILRAYAKQELGLDLSTETTQTFGAPPLIFEAGLSGKVDGAVNFWHFGAKMEAGGMRPLITVVDAGKALGLDANTPLLGYVVTGKLAKEKPQLVNGLVKASRAAKDILAKDDAAWEAIRPLMNAKTDKQFDALKAGFRAGIPNEGPVDLASAQKMLEIMVSLGGKDLMGKATTLPDGVFHAAATN
jgi:NitT/TauT family transport system substrate-binding protein